MSRRVLTSILLVVTGILVVSGYVMAYGVNLSFPSARPDRRVVWAAGSRVATAGNGGDGGGAIGISQ